MLPLASELPGSENDSAVTFTRLSECDRYERQYQKTPFDSWQDHYEYLRNSPTESWSTYYYYFVLFFVRFNQFLHFPQRRDKLSSVYEYEFISVSALLLSFFCLFFNHKLWHLLPLGILWRQIDHIIFWSTVWKISSKSVEMISWCDVTVFTFPLDIHKYGWS